MNAFIRYHSLLLAAPTLLASLAAGCDVPPDDEAVEQAAPAAEAPPGPDVDAETERHTQALFGIPACLGLGKDGVNCPPGFGPVWDNRVLTCKKVIPKQTKPAKCHWPTEVLKVNSSGQDSCCPSWSNDPFFCSGHPTCDAGFTLDDLSGADGCSKPKQTLYKYPQQCDGPDPKKGVKCKTGSSFFDEDEGILRCLKVFPGDKDPPHCMWGGPVDVVAGKDQCTSPFIQGTTYGASCADSLSYKYLTDPDEGSDADVCFKKATGEWRMPEPL